MSSTETSLEEIRNQADDPKSGGGAGMQEAANEQNGGAEEETGENEHEPGEDEHGDDGARERSDWETIDLESITEKDDSWKKRKDPPKWSFGRAVLMSGVLVVIPWLLWGELGDLAYFFSSREPVELGEAQQYVHQNGKNNELKIQNNTYAHISGYPMRMITIKTKDGLFSKNKLIYQLMGSGVYVSESFENSKYAQFLQSTQSKPGADAVVKEVDVEGRVQKFGPSMNKKYLPIQHYYADQYGITFCDTMSADEKKRRIEQLGKGGLSLLVQPDRSVIDSQAGTIATIRQVIPLKGRNALAITDNNLRLTTDNAGQSWKTNEIRFSEPVKSAAWDRASGSLIYAGRNGLIGPEGYEADAGFMRVTQSVEGLMFNDPANAIIQEGETEQPYFPAMLAVGREGLIEQAWRDREGWLPVPVMPRQIYYDAVRAGNVVYAVGTGGAMMSRPAQAASDDPWNYDVSPVDVDWHSVRHYPAMRQIVATGARGKIARRDTAGGAWELWPFDDVPGIEFNSTIHGSAVDREGSVFVAVGDDGAILRSVRGADGSFGRLMAVTGSFRGYGFVQDMLEGYTANAAAARMLNRNTDEKLYDVAWNDGTFYAVGSKGLLMTSPDGLEWNVRAVPVRDKTLYSIVFTDAQHGYIGGESGTMLTTMDGGKTWNMMKSPSKRSIYRLIADPARPEAVLFAGTYGMWGYCHTKDSHCYLRARNLDYHYHGIAILDDTSPLRNLHLVAVGEDGRIDDVRDVQGGSIVTRALVDRLVVPNDIAAADQPIPLMPGYSGGQLVLIAASNGLVYRSADAGYTYRNIPTGLTGDIRSVRLSNDGDTAIACSDRGKCARALHGELVWSPVELPEDVKDVAVVQRTALFGGEKCVYALEPSATKAVRRACFEQPVRAVTALAGSFAAVLTGSDDSLTVSLVDLQNAEAAPQAGTTLSLPGADANPVFRSCGGKLWLQIGKQLWQYGDAGWRGPVSFADDVASMTCNGAALAVLTTAGVRNGVWHVTTSTLKDDVPEKTWEMDVGFDPTRARVVHTVDGFWLLAASSPTSTLPLIAMSRDGRNWSWHGPGTTDFYAIDQGTGITAAVGSGGTVALSKDMGITWSKVDTSTKQTLRDVCISNDGQYGIAVGDAGTILYTKSNIDRWHKATYDLKTDLTSCTIDETDGRFSIYLGGKNGILYVSQDRLSTIQLVPSPSFENIESLATLSTGEVIAVGGNYQNPDSVCEEGYLLTDGSLPGDQWKTLLLCLAMIAFWAYTLRTFVLAFQHRNDLPPVFEWEEAMKKAQQERSMEGRRRGDESDV